MWLWAAVWVVTATATTVPPWQTGESRGEDLSISVITFGPGDDITEWFGHGAIVVEDTRLQQSRLYNYGEYSFDPTMLLRYAAGHLTFQVGERDVDKTYAIYARLDRDIRSQTLKLTAQEKQELALFLTTNAKPENRDYLYDHYADNCTTRVRDAVDRVIGGQLKASSREGRMTLRGHTRAHTAHAPVIGFFIDFLLNDDVDRPLSTWGEAFLPSELERQLRDLRVVREGRAEAVVDVERVIFRSERGPPATQMHPGFYGLFGAGLGLLLLLLRRLRRLYGLFVVVTGVLIGVPGSVLFFMAFFTDHTVAHGNENLLLAHPFALLLVPLGVLVGRGSQRATRWLRLVAGAGAAVALLSVMLKALPMFDQQNAWQLLLFVPLWSGLAASTFVRTR